MKLVFTTPAINNLKEMTAVMTRAFDDDSKKHLDKDKGGPPGYDNGEFITKWLFENKESTGINATVDGKIVGAAIVWISKNGENFLGNMYVDPKYQDQNIGTKLWQYIENLDKNAGSWTLEIPDFATKNHYFYEKKCGFNKMKEDKSGENVSFIYKKNIR